tara:strand:- start:200 stop:544 length:345 start_codon:yes stop_codon:yes gene_type:complete
MQIQKSDSDFPGGNYSYHGITVKASPNDLIGIFGEPNYVTNTGRDKVNFEWVLEFEDDKEKVFVYLYDWKYYRPLGMDELVEWHIGGESKYITMEAKERINNMRYPFSFNFNLN